jgi:hypothetical protein
MENGLTPEEWDDAQVPTQRRFLSLFMAIVAQGRAESKSTRLSGGKIEAQTSVARVEKAA